MRNSRPLRVCLLVPSENEGGVVRQIIVLEFMHKATLRATIFDDTDFPCSGISRKLGREMVRLLAVCCVLFQIGYFFPTINLAKGVSAARTFHANSALGSAAVLLLLELTATSRIRRTPMISQDSLSQEARPYHDPLP